MSWTRRAANLYRLMFHRRKAETELDAEVEIYFAILADRYVEEGMSREEADLAVRLKHEGPEQVKQKVRNVRFGVALEAVLRDVRYAARMLHKNPGFAAVVVCSLAIGIGANSAIYSFADWWLLRPLPVSKPNDVVAVTPVTNAMNGALNGISYPDYLDLRERNRTFQGLVAQAYSSFGFAPDQSTLPRMKVGMFVSGNFFRTLGVEPALGRGFRRDEDEVEGRDAVVVLSHDLWTSEYNADPAVIGEKLKLNGVDLTIIGVAPDSFTGTDQFLRPSLYVPLAFSPRLSNENNLHQRQVPWLTVKGRLNPGVGIAGAQADLNSIASVLQKSYPRTDGNLHLKVKSQLQFQIDFSPPTSAMLIMLGLLAICVLLVACANVAGLLLSRSHVRARAIALRLALGGGRLSLIRQLLIENLLLAIAGGIVGLAIAYTGVKFFNTLPPPSSDIPFRVDIRLDHRALLFTAAISILSTFLFGLVPALRATRPDLVTSLKTADAASSAKTRLWGRKLLVGGQVALSLVLLIVSGRLVEGFHEELTRGPGFRTDQLFLMTFDSSLVHYTDVQRNRFYQQLLDKARLAPDVKSAVLASNIPLAMGASLVGVVPDGYQLKSGQDSIDVFDNVVSDGYFATMQIPIVQGRSFINSDNANAPAVAIVNQQFARHFWPNGSPLGKRFRLRNADGRRIEIVGVATNSKYVFISEAPLDCIYLPFTQNQRSLMTLISEPNSPGALALVPVLKRVVQTIDRNMPVFDTRSMQDLYLERAMKTPKLITDTVAWLGVMGLILAVVGLYGLLAFSVGRRTREIGIRMALGADRHQVVRMIMQQGFNLEVAGVAVGLVAGVAAYKVINSSLFFDFGQHGMFSMITVTLLLFATMTVATYLPARRASRIDPIRALRDE